MLKLMYVPIQAALQWQKEERSTLVFLNGDKLEGKDKSEYLPVYVDSTTLNLKQKEQVLSELDMQLMFEQFQDQVEAAEKEFEELLSNNHVVDLKFRD